MQIFFMRKIFSFTKFFPGKKEKSDRKRAVRERKNKKKEFMGEKKLVIVRENAYFNNI